MISIDVPQQFLNGYDAIAIFQQLGGKGVPEAGCLCMVRRQASPLRRGVLEYPGSSGMAHAVLPLRETKVVTILTPNLGSGQAFLVAKQDPERSAPAGRQEKI